MSCNPLKILVITGTGNVNHCELSNDIVYQNFDISVGNWEVAISSVACSFFQGSTDNLTGIVNLSTNLVCSHDVAKMMHNPPLVTYLLDIPKKQQHVEQFKTPIWHLVNNKSTKVKIFFSTWAGKLTVAKCKIQITLLFRRIN